MMRPTKAVILMSLLFAACGGSTEVQTGGGGNTGDAAPDVPTVDAPDSAKQDVTPPGDARVPSLHRASATDCAPAPVPPEPHVPDAGPPMTITCHVHADCVAKPRGRCIFFPTDPPVDPGGTRCVYDECQKDTDCPAGSACECGSIANACRPGNCRVDADCAASGFCSPTVDVCNRGITGYDCHTPSDTCIDDSDCSGIMQKCRTDDATGVWGCSPVGCA